MIVGHGGLRERDAAVERVVVLGCGGFIGSHLLDRLLQDPRMSVEGWDTSVDKIRHHLDEPRLRLHLDSIVDERAAASLETPDDVLMSSSISRRSAGRPSTTCDR